MPDLLDREALLKWAEAQQDTNRLIASQLNIERRKEAMALESIASTEHFKQEVRQLILEIRKLLDYFRSYAMRDDALRDYFENLSERIDRIERGQMFILMEKADSPHVQQEIHGIIDAHSQSIIIESKRRQLSSYYRSLNRLQEQRAEGVDDLELLNRIDRIKEEILILEKELG